MTALLVFTACYTLNIGIVTVFYHRAFAHRSLRVTPRAARWLAGAGSWLTGIDAAAWVCMHRLHHACSDRAGDPHSPVREGLLGVPLAQLRGYERALYGLLVAHPDCTSRVVDLPFGVHWLNRHGWWWLPYAVHAAVATALAAFAGAGVGVGYFAGLMSHPLQGWMVNGLGHARGPRNFDTPDGSRNHWLTAALVCGEGLQNNHHRYPASARFSHRWFEPDLGYLLCLLLERLGLVEVDRTQLMPRAGVAWRRGLWRGVTPRDRLESRARTADRASPPEP